MHNPSLKSYHDCLCPVADIEAPEDDADVAFYGGFGDVEEFSDFAVAFSAGHQ